MPSARFGEVKLKKPEESESESESSHAGDGLQDRRMRRCERKT